MTPAKTGSWLRRGSLGLVGLIGISVVSVAAIAVLIAVLWLERPVLVESAHRFKQAITYLETLATDGWTQATNGQGPLSGALSKQNSWHWFQVQSAWRAYIATPPGSDARSQNRAQLIAALQRYTANGPPNTSHLETVAKRFLSLGKPGQAAQANLQLAAMSNEHAYRWYVRAASNWLAAGQAECALDAWMDAFNSAPSRNKRQQAGLQVMQVAQQTGQARSFQSVIEVVQEMPADAKLLNSAIGLARAYNKSNQAAHWSERYLMLRPRDSDARRRDVRIAVASGDLERAVRQLKIYTGVHPGDRTTLERLAQVQVWLGWPRQAVATYEQLAQLAPGGVYETKLIELGRQTYDHYAVLNALKRLRAHGNLDAQRRRLFIETLVKVGRPTEAVDVLRQWIAQGDPPKPSWWRLAHLQRQLQHRDEALHTWQRYVRRFGRGLTETRRRAHLQIGAWRFEQALDVLLSLPQKPHADNEATRAYWRITADMAWRLHDKVVSRRAYAALLDLNALTPRYVTRLIQSAVATGHWELAMRATTHAWRDRRSQRAVLAMLGAASDQDRSGLVDRLYNMTATDRPSFDESSVYWRIAGSHALAQGDVSEARKAFKRALAIAPDEPSIRAGLIYTLVGGGWDATLTRRLTAWRGSVGRHADLIQAFAAGYQKLGAPKRAVRWFARAAHLQPKNYLLFLSYADALSQAHRDAAAVRVRRYALSNLRPRLLAAMQVQDISKNTSKRSGPTANKQLIQTQGRLLSADASNAWFSAVIHKSGDGLDVLDRELLLDHYLAQQQPAYARYWLLKAQARRLSASPDQRMSVALARHDRDKIGRLLTEAGNASSSSSLDAATRISALRQIGHEEQAQAIALDHVTPGPLPEPGADSFTQAAGELYRRMPQQVGIRSNFKHVERLDVTSLGLFAKRSWQDNTLAIKSVLHYLSTPTAGFDLSGLDESRSIQLSFNHRSRRGQSRLALGFVDTAEQSRVRFDFQQRWQFSQRLQGRVFGHYNATATDQSVYLRGLGVRDSVGTGFSWRLTPRDTVRASLSYAWYRSRLGRDTIGRGLVLNSAVSHGFSLGAAKTFRVRAFANSVKNEVGDDLPQGVAERLPDNVGADSVISERFTFTGVGATVARGEPDGVFPQVASPRFSARIDVGYVMPADTVGMTAAVKAATRVVGSDALSVHLAASRNGTQVGGTNYSAGVQYQYFWGR